MDTDNYRPDVDEQSGRSNDSSSIGNDLKVSKGLETAVDFSSKQSTTTSENGSSCKEDTKEAIKGKLSKKETKRVTFIRFCVMAALLVAAAAISVVVFLISSNAESDDFETQYNAAAGDILESLENINANLASISAVGIAFTSEGLGRRRKNSSAPTDWPFVVLPDFHYRAMTARLLSGVLTMSIEPLVTDANRDAWETYTVGPAKNWIFDGIHFQEKRGLGNFEEHSRSLDDLLMTNYTRKPINIVDESGAVKVHPGPGPYFPHWQTNPVLFNDHINEDETGIQKHPAEKCATSGTAELSGFEYGRSGSIHDENRTIATWATLYSIAEGKEVEYTGELGMTVVLPVHEEFESKVVVAVLRTYLRFSKFMENILPPDFHGVTVVVENTCDGYFTFQIDGHSARSLGPGDLHEQNYNMYQRTADLDDKFTLDDGTSEGAHIDSSECFYRFHVYPSETFAKDYYTNTPILVTFAVAMVFLFSIGLFIVYSILVEKRQELVLNRAAHSTAIVSAMFPKNVRDRLLEDDQEKTNKIFGSGNQLKSFLNSDGTVDGLVGKNSQIADLYTQCTVMFADISGFTAWSSTRGPEHVFALLQTIYNGFDQIAKRRKVFKVETIGDCYLAVTGLPEPQPAHALIMARFAWECKQKLVELTRELEVTLGPDCSDLRMRFGMHSGPVTAGVLRGDRARFQLFGDTVNTASRMESTGVRDRIQITHTTADLLIAAGKEHWIVPREDVVEAKGKGLMQSYWLNPSKSQTGTSRTGSSDNGSRTDSQSSCTENNRPVSKALEKQDRLVEWMMDLLLEKIKNIKTKHAGSTKLCDTPTATPNKTSVGTYLDDVVEVIPMVEYESDLNVAVVEAKSGVDVPEGIGNDLRQYVAIIAQLYCNNPFHSFEHACHVTMSVNKLLTRIVSPDVHLKDVEIDDVDKISSELHNCTYGIHSDALAQFAIVFSALIHDVDHRGCSNTQLIKENQILGSRYGNKSVAEQNSLDLALNLLLTDQFKALRVYIFGPNEEDLGRFRQLIVNSVLATDIFDKELNALRKARWERAFSEEAVGNEEMNNAKIQKEQSDRKATIVIEHIIQASDVSHTMQHWQVYTKWNKFLFKEMYQAYKAGRMGADPLTFWYKGELSFFDNYVIPLAKKLKDCNVFGVSSDEYLNYAVNNRSEWEMRGEAIVEELAKEMKVEDNEDGD